MAGDGVDRWLSVALDAAHYVLDHLVVQRGKGVHLRYVGTEDLLIHNANLLGARLLARTGLMAGQSELLDLARSCAQVSIAAIRPNGLIPYGEGKREAWVDGFHTGFVVEALADLEHYMQDSGISEAAGRVLTAYRTTLFEEDGRPLLYPGRRYPTDIITGAQGIQTFAKAGGHYVKFARKIAARMLDTMRSKQGTFMYRRGRLHRKPIPYARWSDAPMCLALARLGQRLSSGSPSDMDSSIGTGPL